MPVPKQLTHIAIFRTRYPDSRKAIFPHQLQQQLRVLAVGLLLLDALGFDLRWIADPHLKTQLCQQSLEPAGIPGRLHPHSHVDSSPLQVSIELLGLPIAVVQSLFAIFAGLLHQKCNLLKARVIIYAYHHVRLLPPEPLVVKQPKYTQVEGAETDMQSSGFKFPILRDFLAPRAPGGFAFGERARRRLKSARRRPQAMAPSNGQIGSKLKAAMLRLKKPRMASAAFAGGKRV